MSVRFSSAVATQSPPSLGSRANARRALFALASSRVALTLLFGGGGSFTPVQPVQQPAARASLFFLDCSRFSEWCSRCLVAALVRRRHWGSQPTGFVRCLSVL